MSFYDKEYYSDAASRKAFSITILNISLIDGEISVDVLDSDDWSEGKMDHAGVLHYHTDNFHSQYKYTNEYESEINEEIRKIASENAGILQQTLWEVYISDCDIPSVASALELANEVGPWSGEINRATIGEELLTKVLSAKFHTHFFTKCAILSDVYLNHSNDKALADFNEYNDLGLPLANRVNLANSLGDLDEDDYDNLDYIDETWEQLCEILSVDPDGDYLTFVHMKSN